MKKIIRILHNEDCSCVVGNYGQIYTFHGRGVSDLYDMVKNKPGFLDGAFIADKVVGKAAAALMIIGKVENIYADVISLSALVLLREAGIEADFGRIVPIIENRSHSDWCPLERICYQEKSARNILHLIEGFVAEIKRNRFDRTLTVS